MPFLHDQIAHRDSLSAAGKRIYGE